MKLDEFGAEPEPLTAEQLAGRLGLPPRPHPRATKATRHLRPAGTPLRAKPKARPKAKPKLSASPPFLPATPNNLPTFKTVAARHSEALARYDLTPTRYEGEPMKAPAKPAETLASWIGGGGSGLMNVAMDGSTLRMIVDTPVAAESSRAVALDWLQVGAEPLMSRVSIVSVDRSGGLVYRGDSQAAGYVVPGSSNPVPDDPIFKMLKMEPKLIATTPIEITRSFLATAPEGDAWLTAGIMDQIRRTVVKEILIGDGSTGHVQGVVGATDVETVASPGQLSALNFAKLQALKELAASNQLSDRSGDLFILSSTVASKLEKTAAQSTSGRRLLERLPPAADGVPRSEVAGLGEGWRTDDLTSSVAIYGDWSQLVLGIWNSDLDDSNGMYIVVNPYASEPNVRITAYLNFDVSILRPDRFAVGTYA